MNRVYKVLVVGVGNMGSAHARAYSKIDQFELVGLVARTPERRKKLSLELGNIKEYDNFDIALKDSKPDVVSINTYTESHKEYAVKSLKSGAHIFIEKPLAENIEDAEEIINEAKKQNKKIVVGYILRHHPTWKKFISISQGLGSPLVMRMNLNQQSSEDQWEVHKKLMNSTSPIVDCGVHYVDVMCQMTESRPVRVSGIGAQLTNELPKDKINYGHLQVTFEDGSVGWYEAGWGPMMSETAFFVKDVVGPLGSASIVAAEAGSRGKSSDVDAHCQTERILLHRSHRNEEGELEAKDEYIDLEDEPDHDELCRREQVFFLDGITGKADLTEHQNSAIRASEIVLAADESFRSGKTLNL